MKQLKLVILLILFLLTVFLSVSPYQMPSYYAHKYQMLSSNAGSANVSSIETITDAPIVVAGMPSFKGPQTYKDPVSETTFHVESDGRHITAIDADGKILWRRDPFVDRKLEPYRSAKPVIVYIGRETDQRTIDNLTKKGLGNGSYLKITFDSTQFGAVDIKTGDFFWGGQD